MLGVDIPLRSMYRRSRRHGVVGRGWHKREIQDSNFRFGRQSLHVDLNATGIRDSPSQAWRESLIKHAARRLKLFTRAIVEDDEIDHVLNRAVEVVPKRQREGHVPSTPDNVRRSALTPSESFSRDG